MATSHPDRITRMGESELLSEVVVHDGIAYLAGFTAEPPAGKDIRQQTVETLATIDAQLARAGTDKSQLLTAQIWLADIGEFDAMNAVWIDWLGGCGRPVRACVGATLAGPDYRVEIMVTAALP